jgi:peptide/nickel transport system permease protein
VISVVLRSLAGAVPILLIVSLITFAMIHLIPGDPASAIAGISATPQQIIQLRHDLGLDEPLLEQLLRWYGGLLRGDLGRSLLMGQPVIQVMLFRLPITVALAGYALVLTLVLGLASGLFAALRHNSWIDQAAMIFAMFGISVPNFWLGLLMIILFGVWLGWLPTGGYIAFGDSPLGWLRTSTMPAISLALLQVGLLARITRSTMLEVLRQDYIRTARAKGLPRRLVVVKHALANALIPIVTVVGIIISLSISGSVVTETLFSIPGTGQLLTQAVLNRDYPLVQGGLLMVTALLVMVNVMVDVGYAVLDPRVRHGSG